jgi:N6-L-threonylcarbamoyladenine synthase
VTRILALETTCDETAAAVFDGDANVLSSVVASQAELHAPFGGVVPEVAARAHLERLLPVIDRALAEAGIKPTDLSAVAVARTPGLIGAILVGLAAAKILAATLRVPLIGVNHLHGHIFAGQMTRTESIFPCLGLVVSGGHTNFFRCDGPTDFRLVGTTIDDAAGESFDKVASILGLGYPGGPLIEKAARGGNPKAHAFPRSLIHEDHLDVSFSGLKTAVLYAVHGPNAARSDRKLSESEVADLAASFQQAVIDVLIAKSLRGLKRFGLRRLCVGGGVAANRAFSAALEEMGRRHRIDVIIPPISLCTDNAAMAAVAVHRFRAGSFDPLDLDAAAGLVRSEADLV